MNAANSETAATITSTVDVREVPHAQRHPLIFKTFDGLKAGEAFLLLVDHDPKPVLFELDFSRKGKFAWNYLEQGPEVWRVQMTKTR
ncbi:MAG: DUF2249 domain-containing protein [Acidobacteriota bacterium]|nr:DUF2249 domain-containing protein [Acidobacteriota bacterium]